MQYISDIIDQSLKELLDKYAMQLIFTADRHTIPGSHWGENEAGLVGSRLFVRNDTPVHSALHEACHYICMDTQRRSQLHTDAGGDYAEESAVCYLQILLADYVSDCTQQRLMQDMNDWGYSFRLGSAERWFSEDAQDAKQWLLDSDLITPDNKPTWKIKP